MNDEILYIIITALTTILASTGFWSYLEKRRAKKSVATKLLIGLAHDRISNLANSFIYRGWITPDEFENLNDYLVVPYYELGGNGYINHLMLSVKELPLVRSPHDAPRPKNESPAEFLLKNFLDSEKRG